MVTGFTNIEPTIAGKSLELLKEIAPPVNRVAFLFNPATAPYAEVFLNPFKAAASSFGVEAIAASVRDTSELESVIVAQASAPNGGLVVMTDSFLTVHRVRITSLAARYRLPAVYPFRYFTEIGGLLSYGSDQIDKYSARGNLCRSHPQGLEAERTSRPGPGQVRAGDQREDGQGAWPHSAR